jgi:hypothetical protein
MNCNFCKRGTVPHIVKVSGVYKTFYQCFRHPKLRVSWKTPGVFGISNGSYRIRNVPGGKFYLDRLLPSLKVLMRLESDPKVTPENFEKKLKVLLAFS